MASTSQLVIVFNEKWLLPVRVFISILPSRFESATHGENQFDFCNDSSADPEK